jgi:sugar lactone lactonase YvrE
MPPSVEARAAGGPVFERLGEATVALGESPVWDDRRNCLFFVDIRAPAVHAIGLDGHGFRTWRMPSLTGSIGLAESGRLIVALKMELAILDPDTGALDTLAAITGEPATNRLNDGKVGPDGAFWVGSMDNNQSDRKPLGSLYRIDGQGRITRAMAGGLIVSNGLAWSPDGRTLFHSDSNARWIDRADFDPSTGAASNRTRIVSDIAADTGRPDGAACTAEGDYLSAGVSAGRLNLWSRDGALTQSWPVPAPAPTMPCFCGPDLRTLVVTTLQPGPDREQSPLSGALFIGRSPVAGAPVQRWRDG